MTTKSDTVRFKKHLPCKLEPDELLAVSRKLTHEMNLRDAKAEEKKKAMSEYNDAIALIDARISGFRKTLDTETEDREVECERVDDNDARLVRYYRLDTMEKYDERGFFDDELQMEIPGTVPSVSDLPPEEEGPPRDTKGDDPAPGEHEPKELLKEPKGSRARKRKKDETPDEIQTAAATPEEAEALRLQKLAEEDAAWPDAVGDQKEPPLQPGRVRLAEPPVASGESPLVTEPDLSDAADDTDEDKDGIGIGDSGDEDEGDLGDDDEDHDDTDEDSVSARKSNGQIGEHLLGPEDTL